MIALVIKKRINLCRKLQIVYRKSVYTAIDKFHGYVQMFPCSDAVPLSKKRLHMHTHTLQYGTWFSIRFLMNITFLRFLQLKQGYVHLLQTIMQIPVQVRWKLLLLVLPFS